MSRAADPSPAAPGGRHHGGLISSRRHPLVRRLRQLHSAKGRREQQLLLLEGTHLVQEALRLGLEPVDLLATEPWQRSHGAVLRALPAGLAATMVSEEVLAAVATTDHPDGVVATLAPPPASWGPASPRLVLALDGVQDPGNLGTLIRTALAAGVEALWLAEGADPLQPKVLRASAGAALALPLQRAGRSDLLHQLELLATPAGPGALQVVATVPPRAGAMPYWELDWLQPTVLMLGQEGAGLGEAFLQRATHRVTVPHSAAVESLNVAVAAAPLLLERWRQQQRGGPLA
ncbi:RNA methyltransferase [Cyanobium sp. NIES-981]|uniref:TrmH family RNA methyltransferase n=1 Tax=Cyanobium sp. NIES-981 TaxID=1851505 RepID=UPI0007DD4228|nr:RNA methyltransferase [Cyanobium sp. NIES-981]SBO43053.1 putative enzyme [Cyanobium sp. NIES-981]